MKRALLFSAAAMAAGLLTAAAVVGPELLSGYRFMDALDRYYAGYEANGGAWPQIQDSCALCHGVNGQPRDAQYAALAGQPAAYIETQLHAFAEGRRRSAQMGPLAANLSDTQIKSLADYFSRQRPETTEAPERDDALAKRGEAVVAARGCIACHGERLSGGPLGPRIAGQGEGYLSDQLKAFKHGQRQDPAQAMNAMASSLSDEELKATVHYLSGLAPTQPHSAH
ncbi:c-type cytochrome [Pseudomonas sp. BN411]|uniref:c-type cytochrome n=1 Tax=Pseudomonas sp. BN411 TaxID=2567887 RepID=UPI0024586202|nr:c-type cytochrome [Pseudomonas sp. BN411]MDH4560467.1 c-type cytochrome [Pseudomonas sp. BN411]